MGAPLPLLAALRPGLPPGFADAVFYEDFTQPGAEWRWNSGPIVGPNNPYTFSRNSNATRVNPAGLIETLGNNVLRIDYDPVTLVQRGALIESSATNLILQSADLSQATSWVVVMGTVSANDTASPDGGTNAALVTATSANCTVLQTNTQTGATYTFSIYLKRKTGSGTVQISVDGVTYTTVAITSAWARYSVTQTVSAGANLTGLQIVTSGDAVWAWGAQLVQSAIASSYIPTTSASVGRSTDTLKLPAPLFATLGAANATPGTLWVEADDATVGVITLALLAVNDNTTSNRAHLTRDANSSLVTTTVTASGSSQYSSNVSGFPINTTVRAALSLLPSAMRMAGAGVVSGTVGSGTIPTVTQIGLGNNTGSNAMTGHLKRAALLSTPVDQYRILDMVR